MIILEDNTCESWRRKLNLLNIATPNTVFKHHAKLKCFRNIAKSIRKTRTIQVVCNEQYSSLKWFFQDSFQINWLNLQPLVTIKLWWARMLISPFRTNNNATTENADWKSQNVRSHSQTIDSYFVRILWRIYKN